MKASYIYLLAITMLVFGVVACTKICDLAKRSAASISPQLASKWACTNPTQMNKDIQAAIAGSFVCKKSQENTGVVGSVVCPIVVGFVKDQLANRIPASWGCDSSLVGTDAAATISTVCSAVFPI